MGKLNFRGYLISRFYPTREIRENLMHAKNRCFTVLTVYSVAEYFSQSTAFVPVLVATVEDPLVSMQP